MVHKVPPKSSSPLVKELFRLLDASGITYAAFAKKAGFAHKTLEKWKRGQRSPTMINLETGFEVLGFKLIVAPNRSDT